MGTIVFDAPRAVVGAELFSQMYQVRLRCEEFEGQLQTLAMSLDESQDWVGEEHLRLDGLEDWMRDALAQRDGAGDQVEDFLLESLGRLEHRQLQMDRADALLEIVQAQVDHFQTQFEQFSSN